MSEKQHPIQPLLTARGIAKQFSGVVVLKHIDFTLLPGQVHALLGGNGAGKSTFFLLANGVLRPGAGRILFRGAPVGGGAKQLNVLRRGVGLVFQDPEVQLLGGSVEDEVSFGPMNLRLPVGEVRARVDTAIRSFALEEYRGRAPQYLSGGEKKRVTLADALAMEPQMLLLDEPAASLDPANTRLLEQNLQMLSEQGLGLMVATHDVDFAWRWATRVLVFRGGRLAGDGEPREIFENVSLLRTCGLEQPVLYRVGRVLGLAAPPHTVEELEQEWKP